MSGLKHSSTALAEAVWLLLALTLLLLSCCRSGDGELTASEMMTVNSFPDNRAAPCEEIYVVREGETLQTISDKCGDPYIVEENPHIHDPDDVFPGLVIKITPFKIR